MKALLHPSQYQKKNVSKPGGAFKPGSSQGQAKTGWCFQARVKPKPGGAFKPGSSQGQARVKPGPSQGQARAKPGPSQVQARVKLAPPHRGLDDEHVVALDARGVDALGVVVQALSDKHNNNQQGSS